MTLSKFMKKWSWIALLIIYLVFIWINTSKGFVSATIGLVFATITLIYNNWDSLRRWIHSIWYWIIKMQFEWRFVVNIEADIDSVSKIDERTIVSWIEKTLKETELKYRMKDIVISRKNRDLVVYIAPLGINLSIEKYLSEGTWDEKQKQRINITGHTLANYRQTKRMLQSFLKIFFNELEGSLTNITEKKYSLQVSSGEMDVDFYEKQFIKGIENVDYFTISKKRESYAITVNKRVLEIVSEYKEDIISHAKHYLLQLR